MKFTELGNVLDVQNGFAFDSNFFSESEGVPLIRIRDLKNGLKTEVKYKGRYSDDFLVNKGDLLIGMDGEFRCYEWKGEVALLNQRVCRLKNFDKNIHPKYLYFGINSLLKKIEDNTAFVTVKHISSKQIREIQFPFPEYEQQVRTVNILEKVVILISHRKESICHLDELLKSAFLSMLENLRPINKKEFLINDLKSGGGESFSNGPFGSDLLTTELKKEGVPVIYIRDIRNGIFSWKSGVYVSADKARTLPNCQVYGGDILVAKVGDPPGISAVYPESLGLSIITQDVIRIRVNKKIISPQYLSYYLNSVKGRQLIKKISVEGTRNRFALGDFKKLKIEVPDFENQEKFVTLIVYVESLKQKYQTSLKQMNQLLGSLSDRTFSTNH